MDENVKKVHSVLVTGNPARKKSMFLSKISYEREFKVALAHC